MEGMRLRLEDLQVGDTGTKSSLDNIFNVYITLVDSKVIDGDIIGKIAFIGKELGDESGRVVEENDNICIMTVQR